MYEILSLFIGVGLTQAGPVHPAPLAGLKRVDFRDLSTSLVGTYQVLTAGGASPKEENKYGSVEVDTEEAVFTFPYCPEQGDVCDPGYIILSFKDTLAYQFEIQPGVVQYQIQSGNQSYDWEVHENHAVFRRYKYTLGGQPLGDLVFEIKRSQAIN